MDINREILKRYVLFNELYLIINNTTSLFSPNLSLLLLLLLICSIYLHLLLKILLFCKNINY